MPMDITCTTSPVPSECVYTIGVHSGETEEPPKDPEYTHLKDGETLYGFRCLESAMYALREVAATQSKYLPVGWMFVVRRLALNTFTDVCPGGVILSGWKKISKPSDEKPWVPIGEYLMFDGLKAHSGLETFTSVRMC
jgi:hypothetical protein